MLKVILNLPKYFFRFCCLGFARGEHVTRYYMYKQLAKYRGAATKGEARVLSLSGSQALCRVLGYPESSIQDVAYPEYNILHLPFPDASFDAVVSDQVLEHVEGDPQQAMDESLRVLKSGGIMVHATCFINPIHAAPSDFWRFTPDALALLSKKARVIEATGWGNVFIWLFFIFGVRYEKIPDNRFHPFNWLATFNQHRLPVTTWVVAQKS